LVSAARLDSKSSKTVFTALVFFHKLTELCVKEFGRYFDHDDFAGEQEKGTGLWDQEFPKHCTACFLAPLLLPLH
jgi:hypothetical protein